MTKFLSFPDRMFIALAKAYAEELRRCQDKFGNIVDCERAEVDKRLEHASQINRYMIDAVLTGTAHKEGSLMRSIIGDKMLELRLTHDGISAETKTQCWRLTVGFVVDMNGPFITDSAVLQHYTVEQLFSAIETFEVIHMRTKEAQAIDAKEQA